MIVFNIDVMLARRKMSLTELSERVGITMANLSILKTGKAKAVRVETLNKLCHALDCQPGDLLDLLVSAEISVFRGEVSVSLRAADLRLTGVDQNAVCYQQRIYENARRGEHSPAEDQLICPTREDAAIVYRFLSSQGGFPHGPELLYQRLMASGIGYGKMLVALDALMELGLIAREKNGFRLLPVHGKVDLMSAPAIRRLSESE